MIWAYNAFWYCMPCNVNDRASTLLLVRVSDLNFPYKLDSAICRFVSSVVSNNNYIFYHTSNKDAFL